MSLFCVVHPITLNLPIILSATDERRPSVIELRHFYPLDELPSAVALGAGVAMETVVIVAIGVLATIFLASFVALVVVCRHRYCHPHDLLHHFDSKSVNQRKASKSIRVSHSLLQGHKTSASNRNVCNIICTDLYIQLIFFNVRLC